MRAWLYTGAVLAVAGVAPLDAIRGIIATAASTLFEATPFVLASIVLARVLRVRGDASAFVGCGCGTGPSARSLPAAAASWLIFGPAIACCRVAAAVLVARLLRSRRPTSHDHIHEAPHLLGELSALVPAALLAGGVAQLATVCDLSHLPPAAQIAAGTVLGFASAPCALGAIAVAGSLRVRAPLAALAFLCIAGIADARVLTVVRRRLHAGHDVAAYALLALALSLVAAKHGAGLVHPAIATALCACAAVAASLAVTYRRHRCSGAWAAPALMILGAFASAPAPQYHATETTLADVFPGERLTFTGALVRRGNAVALVRYAITCCRADAAPIAVRLSRDPAYAGGAWLRADGIVESKAGQLQLAVERVTEIPAPADPFIYR